ncbi:a1-alpha2 repression [Aphanomyces cochlioides]|nr:a1-alpha2 repression [Aphanomyces cochlioides]
MVKTLVVLSIAATAAALPTYVAQVPNADKVSGVAAIGHVNPAGGGARNPFGIAFAGASHTWSTALCQADSDGDGATNGEELGDPCCTWRVGATLATTTATHPGVANTFTADQLNALKCATSSGSSSNSTNSSSTGTNSSSTGTTAAPSSRTTTAPSSGSASGSSTSSTTAAPTTTATSGSSIAALTLAAAVVAVVAQQ